MSKVIRKIRQIKKKNRAQKEYTLLSYPAVQNPTEATVIDITYESGKCAPIAVIEMNGNKYSIAATEGISIGSKIIIGDHS
jgi:ribosomal protein L2